jgi:hypothetical protein
MMVLAAAEDHQRVALDSPSIASPEGHEHVRKDRRRTAL